MEHSVELKMNMRGFQSIKLKQRVSQNRCCVKQIVKSICKQVSCVNWIGNNITGRRQFTKVKVDRLLSLVFLTEKN